MHEIYTNLIKQAIKKGFVSPDRFLAFKKSFCSQNKITQPTNADLREIYNTLLKARKIKHSGILERAMLSRAVRTQSGVAVVAVLTKPSTCPGKCLYCPTEKGMPKSYLSNEPAVMRAIANKFDPYLQTHNRLKVLELNGHATDKIELIVMGGTFSYFPKTYQQWFITECFRACNDYPRKRQETRDKRQVLEILKKEQERNEKASHRIIGLTLETRPDYIDAKEIINFRTLGCTRVELGVQSIFDEVLKINRRGHAVAETIAATKLLKDAGFKINYHMMPGLPGSTPKKDYQMFKELFSNLDFQPDMLKIYPTVMLKESPLYKIWTSVNKKLATKIPKTAKKSIIHYTAAAVKCIIKNYKPLTDTQFEKLILRIKNEIIPPYVRIARLVRDVPTVSILGGPNISNLRQIIAKESHCPCIRCREVRADYKIKNLPAMLLSKINSKSTKLRKLDDKIKATNNITMQAGKIILDRINYAASGGQEIFLQYASPSPLLPTLNKRRGGVRSKLFALLRLRIPSVCHSGLDPESNKNLEILNPQNNSITICGAQQVQDDNLYKLLPILKNAALIREVHTYGKLTKIDTLDKNSPQHIGLGKKLIQEAERIAKEEYNLQKIVVIAGVGVRDYYRRLGYRQQDTYMVKNL